jgi:hypothetical protein
MKIVRLVLMSLVLLTGCAPAVAPAPSRSPLSPLAAPVSPIEAPVRQITPEPPARQLTIEPIQIDRVEIRIADSLPSQVVAHVTGVVGDGCSSVQPVKQARDGHTLTLTINRQRRTDAVCTEIAKLYEENIRLEGEFPAGEYVLKVNSVTQTFTVR